MLASLRLERRLARNALLKFTSEVVARLASFALVIWAARQLGAAGFGFYSYGLALAFVSAQLADMGLQLLISREVAVHGRRAQPLVQTALSLKVWLSLPALLLVALASGGRPGWLQLSFICLGLALTLHTFVEFVAHVWRGEQRLWDEARLLAAARLLATGAGAVVLAAGGGLVALSLVAAATGLAASAWAVSRLYAEGWLARGERARGERARADWRPLLAEAWPLGVATFLSIAYTRLALFLLEYRLDEVAVAHYSAAQRLVEPAQLLPAALLAAVFPAYAGTLRRDRAEARRLGWSSSLILALAGGSLALTLALAAPLLMPWLYGSSYGDGVPVLRLLSLSILPAYVNYSLTHLLVARGQQRLLLALMALTLLVHAAVSWQLVAAWGAAGAALSLLCAELLLFAGCLLALWRSGRQEKGSPGW
jgi:O-antigen/teichoic acid export membrane protein